VYYTGEFEPFVASMFGRRVYGDSKLADTKEFETFFAAVSSGRAVLGLPLGTPPRPSEPLSRPFEFANRARERYFTMTVRDTFDVVSNLRQVKTPYEQSVLQQSADISSEAHVAGMRTAKPGKFEYEVEAAIEHAFLARGASGWGYPSIVGSGPNATILHYETSRRQMKDGDLLAGGRGRQFSGLHGGHHAHVSGEREVHAGTKGHLPGHLSAQEAGIKAARAGSTAADITKAAADVAKAGLLSLASSPTNRAINTKSGTPHGIMHWIGVDVHDAGDYERKLEPGMAFVVEPGIYVRPQALDNLPDTTGEPRLQDGGGPRGCRGTRTSACASRTRSC
jgi:Xaa-Pro aminopeptidase